MSEKSNGNHQIELPFKTSHAFVIGINDYETLPRLNTAVNDANKLAEVLAEEQKFSVHPPLLNASYQEITELLEKIIHQKVRPDDRVLFYFAGHGVALDGEDGPAGYIAPVDASNHEIDRLISMTQLYDAIKTLTCRHLLLILDCCFSGAFKWSSRFRDIGTFMPKKIYKERFDRFINDPAWQVITSSSYDQKALDILQERPIGKRDEDSTAHSPFAQALFEGLAGKADVIPGDGGDGVITASELYLYVRERVEPNTIAVSDSVRQTPGLFPLEKHDKGEYIFLHPRHRLNLPQIPDKNPYKGLHSFNEEDSELFYGRDEVIKELVNRVENHNFLVVTGASGTGKSSVIKAGLLPVLRHSGYNILPIVRPGKKPLAALESVFRQAELFGESDSIETSITVINERLKNNKAVLVVDQYEELITRSKPEERERFMKTLEKLLRNNKKNLFKIILTVRADFEPQFEDWVLGRYWQEARFTIRPFNTEELREIIEKPALQEVLYFEPPELVDRLIEEVVQAPGALPLLSFTLSELYRLSIKNDRGRVLHEDDYKELGGVIGALRTRADSLYQNLDYPHQCTMRRIMIRMISLEGGEMAGKRVMMDELSYAGEEENQQVDHIIEKLEEARLIVNDKDSSGLPYIEPAHDALVRAWGTLWEWVKAIGEDKIILQSRLSEAFKDYARLKNKSLLWDNDPRIDLLNLELQNPHPWLNKQEAAFVRNSVKHKSRKRRRFVITVTSIIIVLAALTVWAFLNAKEANRQKQVAEKNANTSEANRLAFIANEKVKEDPTVAMRIAEKAWQLDKNKTVTSTIDKIYQDNNFYKIIAELKNQSSFTFSPDRNYILTDSADKSARLWDWQGKVLQEFKGHQKDVTYVAFSPDGKNILTGSQDKTARLWDRQGNLVQEFKGHKNEITSLAFSPDGKNILTGSADKTACLWDRQGNRLQEFKGHGFCVNSVAFSPDGKTILTGSQDKTARLWDRKGKVLQEFKGHQKDVIYVTFSPDGRNILTGSADKTARLWDRQGNLVQEFTGHKHNVSFVTFSPDGRNILTGSWDKTARLWDRQGNLVQEFKGHQKEVTYVAFSPNGKAILTGSQDKTIRLWDLRRNQVQQFKGHEHYVSSTAFSPDGKNILTGSRDNTARLWDRQGNLVQKFRGHKRYVSSVAFSPDGKNILTGSWDKTAWLWDRQRKVLKEFKGHQKRVTSVAFSPDGKNILTGSQDKTARLWDFQGNPVQEFKGHQKSVTSVAFSADGKNILTGSEDKTARLWDRQGKVLKEFKGHRKSVTSVAFSPDGKTILTGSLDKTACLWDLQGNPVQEFKGHQERVTSVAFSPDGKTILTGSWDNTARLWDRWGNLIQEFKKDKHYITSVAFSPDGKTILTGSLDKTALLWKVPMSLEEFLKTGNFEQLTDEQKEEFGIKD